MSEWWVVVTKHGRIEPYDEHRAECPHYEKAAGWAEMCDVLYPDSGPHRAVLVTDRVEKPLDREPALWGEYRYLKKRLSKAVVRVHAENCLDGFERALECLGLCGIFRARFEKEKEDGK